MDWLNWQGWTTVAIFGALWAGFFSAWALRGSIAAGNIEELERRLRNVKAKLTPALGIVEALARCKDPRTCPSIDDELEAFNRFIVEAKDLVGDLSEPEPLYGWGEA